MRELEAKNRQIYDPITNTYDDRNRRATDLKECSRVTLPKPISVKREAQIELRGEIHGRIFREYRRKYCRENGEQEMNLNEKEKGLERLKKRIQDEEILVMKTDKSGKLSVTTREKYLEMGREHTGEDEEIGREKLKEIDTSMSDHATAWVGIWGTGLNHDQTDRIVGSKVSKSENTAKLYLLHKDHKKDLKTRPVGTANSSNTMAFANSVSDLIENIANGEKDKSEVISHKT